MTFDKKFLLDLSYTPNLSSRNLANSSLNCLKASSKLVVAGLNVGT
jgi:hypothetical protein